MFHVKHSAEAMQDACLPICVVRMGGITNERLLLHRNMRPT